MGIQGRSLEQQEYERALERQCPVKVKLVRARPFNCTGGSCFANGRESVSLTCPVCAGTGYLGVERINSVQIVTATGLPFSDADAPAADFYLIYGDVQTGHGLYGSGGDYLKLLPDLGKLDIGDATFYCKMFDRDHRTGLIIYPKVDPSLPRPDRIYVTTSVTPYNVVRELIINIGSSTLIGRVFTLDQGTFTAVGQGTR